jgi:hypothetical protein
LASGDTLMVARASYLVSDSAVSAMDLALRQARRDAEQSRANETDRLEQLRISQRWVDSLTVNLTLERAFRRETAPSGWDKLVETLENFGLAAGGFAICRMTETR